MHHLAARVLACQSLIESGTAVDILLINEAGDNQHGYVQRLFGQQLVHRLILPERIVGGMLSDRTPEADLLQPAGCGHGAGGADPQVLVVSVAIAGPPLLVVLARGLLVVDIIERTVLSKGAIVEPVVPTPAVNHR